MKLFSAFDPYIVIPVAGLVTMSLFVLGSTTPDLFWSQSLFFSIGLVLYIIIASGDIRLWARAPWLVYGLCIVALLTSYLGPDVRGATRWIEVGMFRIQPSELTKPFIALVFAWSLSMDTRFSYRSLGITTVLFLLPALLVFQQPDLGNVLVYSMMFATMVLLAGIPWRLVMLVAIGGTVLLPVFWSVMREYQKSRIMTFLNPHIDPVGAGYNALQAIIAIGSGQWFGQGLGRGTQSHLLFLPEYHTDFVFASLGEELGFVGAGIVLIFYAVLLARLLYIACTVQNGLSRLFAVGIFSQLFIQVFINVGMNVGVLPITGITLPLISYGGSSVISTFLGLGMVASVNSARKQHPLVIR